MAKKSQITLYIIIGIVVVAAAGLVFYAKSKTSMNKFSDQIKDLGIPTDYQPIWIGVAGCLDEAMIKNLDLMLKVGGPCFWELKDEPVSFYYYKGFVKIPTEDYFLEILTKLVQNDTQKCIDSLDMKGMRLDLDDYIKVNIKDTQKNVIASIANSLTVKNDVKQYTLPEVELSYNVRLKELLNLSNILISRQSAEPILLDVTNIEDLKRRFNVTIGVDVWNDTMIIFSVLDNQSRLNNKPVIYNFGYYRDMNNYPPVLLNRTLDLYEDQEFAGYLEVFDREHDWITFNCTEFPISDTGYIYFVPEQKDVGFYRINLTISDGVNVVNYTINVTIHEVNDVPYLAYPKKLYLTKEELAMVNLTILDEDDDDVEIRLKEGPAGAFISNKQFVWTPFSEGNYTAIIELDDNEHIVDETLEIEVSKTPFIQAPELFFDNIQCYLNHRCYVNITEFILNPSELSLNFSDDFAEFNISDNGIIDFIPHEQRLYRGNISVFYDDENVSKELAIDVS